MFLMAKLICKSSPDSFYVTFESKFERKSIRTEMFFFFISCSVFLVSYSLNFSTLMMFFFLVVHVKKMTSSTERNGKLLYNWRRTVRHRSLILYVYLYIRTNIYFSQFIWSTAKNMVKKKHMNRTTTLDSLHFFSFFSFYSLFLC